MDHLHLERVPIQAEDHRCIVGTLILTIKEAIEEIEEIEEARPVHLEEDLE